MSSIQDVDGQIFVAECADDKIKIKSVNNQRSKSIIDLGFKYVPLPDYYRDIYGDVRGMYYVLEVSSIEEKAKVLSDLRDLRIPFAGGKEWNPQEVFEYLRDTGHLFGSYLAIGWSNHDTAVITEK